MNDYITTKDRHPLEVHVLDERLREYGLPEHATPGSAAGDLRAMRLSLDTRAIEFDSTTIYPGMRALFGTGLVVRVRSSGLVGIVASRSGLSLKHGIRVAQGIGVIDSDYTGELGVILTNDSEEPYRVRTGDRIAQLMLMPVVQYRVFGADAIDETGRSGGFGHTGR